MNVSHKQRVKPAIEISGLEFEWKPGVPVLKIEHLKIDPGERIFIAGPSGSGKSTLLSLIAGIVTPQKGGVETAGTRISDLTGSQRDRFRGDHIGFIFQMFNLIPYLSVIENVLLPCRFSARRKQRAAEDGRGVEDQALALLRNLGMDESILLNQSATRLSMGQQQRVAAARALIGAPEIVIADEPTSSLDAEHRESFIRLLFNQCKQESSTIVFVSHDRSLERLFDRTVQLEDINRAGTTGVKYHV